MSFSNLLATVWQWQDEDLVWNDYDLSVSNQIESTQINQKVIVQIPGITQYKYEITKLANDKATQRNTATNKIRTIRRYNQSCDNIDDLNKFIDDSLSYFSHDNSKSLWQWEDDNKCWIDYALVTSKQIDDAKINEQIKIKPSPTSEYSYEITKLSKDKGQQCNATTKKIRSIRQGPQPVAQQNETNINSKTITSMWQWQDENQAWYNYELPISQQINDAKINEKITIKLSAMPQYNYEITKLANDKGEQHNLKTNKIRQIRQVPWQNDNISTKPAIPEVRSLHKPQENSKEFLSLLQWQWKNNNKYTNFNKHFNNKIQSLKQNETTRIKVFGKLFTITKIDDFKADNSVHNIMHPLRCIVFKPNWNKRIIWQYENDNKNGWNNFTDNKVIMDIDNLDINQQLNWTHKKHQYIITKLSISTASQLNIKIKTTRNLQRILLNIDETTKDDYEKIQVNNAIGCKNECDLFYASVNRNEWQILKIQQVNCNEMHKAAYESILNVHKKSNKNLVERRLFHGTPEININKIISNGFNRDFNKTALYGVGVYFAKNALYSIDYCDQNKNEKKMFLCRVIVDDIIIGTANTMAPLQSDNITHYSCMVDNIYDPTIFVITRDFHAIPEYLITFSRKMHNYDDNDDFFN